MQKKKKVCVEQIFRSVPTGEKYSYYNKFETLREAEVFMREMLDRPVKVKVWFDLEIDKHPNRIPWINLNVF